MPTTIYTFTGTGNSLALARTIAGALGDAEILPIPPLSRGAGEIVPAGDVAGIVAPIYYLGLPSIVAEFTQRLAVERVAYTFAVLTLGGRRGATGLRQLDGILRRRSGRGLDAGWAVQMPGNYLPGFGPPAPEKQAALQSGGDEAARAIAGAIRERKRVPPGVAPVSGLIHRLVYPRVIASIHERDRNFTVDPSCNSCGTCVNVCPVRNISLVEGRPVWQHRCEFCLACAHFCPEHAIQLGRRTAKMGRYHHPAVSIRDMRDQQGPA
ncbi:MAG TPA: EFR1 family ferrodoxin [Methanomicrobiales archaeon]|jgi:ferredoxin|nr:EFR1 family ferrodoxin [Methanomicrobiales archaeon]